MNIIKKIVKNMFLLFAGNLISAILTIVLSIYIARFLGDVLFGRYSFIVTFVALFSYFLDLGYETLIVRDVARDKSKASCYLNNIISMRAILSVLIFIIIFLFVHILDFTENIKILIYLFGISQIIVSLTNVFRVTFRAFERMDYEVEISIFSNIIRCSLGLLFLFLGYGLMEIALIFLYSAIIELIISFFICEKKFVRTKSQFGLGFFKDTIKTALPIFAVGIFALIYVKIDTIMLTFMVGEAVVGWYNAAYNLILGFSPVPHLFMTALLPFMAYTYVKSRETLRDVYEKSFKYLMMLSLPITVGIFLLADKFIILFYGQDFLNSVDALRILSWDILLKFLYLCTWFVLISADKQKNLAIIAGCGAFLNIILNLFLIPKFSLIGAAIATIITETFILVLYLYLAYINNLKIPLKKIFFKPVIACIIMIFFIYYFNYLNIIILVIFSALIYFLILLILKDFSKEDKDLLKKLIKR
ncbi:MAG: flippase [Candidatus Thermoplasmatota archaeon]|jgi:O-antigen/teichoic acid export membrane protein|nr:flippase [Candidatus Thermoplasmatota archaeon]